MNNTELLKNCEKMLGAKTVYMWGCFGQTLTASLLSSKTSQYPANYSTSRQAYLLSLAEKKDVYGCDCVGLIKNALWGGFTNKLVYDASTDFGTEGLYRAAAVKGDIASLPETVGLAVYKKGHIGVYAGDGNVIECTLGSRGDGVVKTPLKAAGWTAWLRIPYIDYIEESKKEPEPPEIRQEPPKEVIPEKEIPPVGNTEPAVIPKPIVVPKPTVKITVPKLNKFAYLRSKIRESLKIIKRK